MEPAGAVEPSAALAAAAGAVIATPARHEQAGPLRPTLRRADHVAAFEALLRARQVPYVAVDEAKRAVFRDAKLGTFDFIVYAESGDNWLVFVGAPTTDRRAKMAEWEAVFGPGFVVVFAMPAAGGFTYRALDGRDVTAGPLVTE
jgi:hypothetical protein